MRRCSRQEDNSVGADFPGMKVAWRSKRRAMPRRRVRRVASGFTLPDELADTCGKLDRPDSGTIRSPSAFGRPGRWRSIGQAGGVSPTILIGGIVGRRHGPFLNKRVHFMIAAVEQIRNWRAHPARMVEELFGVRPDVWQREALEAFPHSPRMAFQACRGPGKTSTLALARLEFFIDRPHRDGRRDIDQRREFESGPVD